MTYFEKSYRDIEDRILYGGGCQVEQYEVCGICGNDIDGDGVEVDGTKYCENCVNRAQKRIYTQTVGFFRKELRNPFETYALKKAIAKFTEDYLDE